MRAVDPQLIADRDPYFAIENGFVLAGIYSPLMGHRSGIDHVRKQKPERRPAQWPGRMMLSVARRPFLRCEPPFPYLPYRGLKATRFLTDTEHFPDLAIIVCLADLLEERKA